MNQILDFGLTTFSDSDSERTLSPLASSAPLGVSFSVALAQKPTVGNELSQIPIAS